MIEVKNMGITAEARLRSLKTSFTKLQRVVAVIRGKKVSEALKQLTFCRTKVAVPIKNLLKSAMANAENNKGMDLDRLFIYRIDTGRSFFIRRFMARAKGRGNRIFKPFCQVRIILAESIIKGK
jgi:large subunit ribosomal protein L22